MSSYFASVTNFIIGYICIYIFIIFTYNNDLKWRLKFFICYLILNHHLGKHRFRLILLLLNMVCPFFFLSIPAFIQYSRRVYVSHLCCYLALLFYYIAYLQTESKILCTELPKVFFLVKGYELMKLFKFKYC